MIALFTAPPRVLGRNTAILLPLCASSILIWCFVLFSPIEPRSRIIHHFSPLDSTAKNEPTELKTLSRFARREESLTYNHLPWIVHCFLPASETRFNLQHHLGLRSILKNAKPDVLYVHYSNEKQLDNLEWQEIVEWYFNVEALPLPKSDRPLDMQHMGDIARAHSGGVIIDMAAIVHQDISNSDTRGWCKIDKDKAIAFMFPHCPYYHDASLFDRCLQNASNCSAFVLNLSSQDANSSSIMLRWGSQASGMFAPSVYQEVDFTNNMPIYDFFSIRDFPQPWYDIARQLYCNDCPSLEPVRHAEPVVPNIAHGIWFDDKWNMSFLQMACLSSALQVLKVEHVFVHSNVEPTGPYWTYLVQRHKSRIVWHHLPKIRQIWGVKLNPKYPHANSDAARFYVLKKYGGIYMDYDLLFLRSNEELRHYDAVMGPAIPHCYHVLQSSHTLFTPRSQFLDAYLQSYKKYSGVFLWNAVVLPVRLYRRMPHTVKVAEQLNYNPERAEHRMIFSNAINDVVRNHFRQAYTFEYSGAMDMQYNIIVSNQELGFHVLKENTILGSLFRLAIEGGTLVI